MRFLEASSASSAKEKTVEKKDMTCNFKYDDEVFPTNSGFGGSPCKQQRRHMEISSCGRNAVEISAA
jgi:hypothetical protein